MATIYAGLGKNEKAFELLEEAYAERLWTCPPSLKSDLVLDTLRSDPASKTLFAA